MPDSFISLFSNKGKTVLLVLLIPLVLTLSSVAWNSVRPETVIQPVTRQLTQLDSSVSALETRVGRMENSSVILDYRFMSIERYLCLDSRQKADLAGIDCNRLVGK